MTLLLPHPHQLSFQTHSPLSYQIVLHPKFDPASDLVWNSMLVLYSILLSNITKGVFYMAHPPIPLHKTN